MSVEKVDTHGGSIRVYVSRDGASDGSVKKFIEDEEEAGLMNLETYRSFGRAVEKTKKNARRNMDNLKSKYERIAGYGAPAKATTALNYLGITSEDIQYIIEDNELKCGKFIPGVNIPIKNKSYSEECVPDLVIIMAWNFFDVIKEQNAWLAAQGTRFVSIKDLQEESLL